MPAAHDKRRSGRWGRRCACRARGRPAVPTGVMRASDTFRICPKALTWFLR